MAAMTLRLPDQLDTMLRLVSDVEERSMSEVINHAIHRYCVEQLQDQTFRNRARVRISKIQGVLDGPPASGEAIPS